MGQSLRALEIFCVVFAFAILSSCGGGGSKTVTTPPQGPQGITFTSPTSFSSGGTRPVALTAGDFNGDGKQDIAVANSESDIVTVFLGNGDGTFQSGITNIVGVTNWLQLLCAGDFNGDGKLDLLVGVLNQGPVLLTGNGDGSFGAEPQLVSEYTYITALAADLNGDGHLDFVTGENPGDAVILGNGDGTFSAATQLQAPTSGFSVFGLAVADFTGDGKPDVVGVAYGSSNASLIFSRGKGDGTFEAATNATLPSSGGSALASADFNHDGKQDLLVGYLSSADILIGNGDGTFQDKQTVSAGQAAVGVSVLAADLNNDGLPDALVTNYGDGTLNISLNDGAGFTSTFSQPHIFSIAPHTGDIKVADFNGDGLPDVAVVNDATGKVYVFLSHAN